MVLVKILKRKDASSVIVAILVAMIVYQPLNIMTGTISNKLINVGNSSYGYGPGGGWKNEYLFPLVWMLLQLVILEILAWICVMANRPLKRKK